MATITTTLGAQVTVLYEDESYCRIIEYDIDGFQKVIRSEFDHNGKDAGTGKNVYVLINSSLDTVCLTAEEFTKWELNPDWGHSLPMAIEDVLAVILGGLNPNSKFKGATDEQAEMYMKDPIARKIVQEDRNCRLCTIPTGICPVRHDNFSVEALEAEIAHRQV